MKASPFLEELLHLAAKLLEKNGQTQIANQIYNSYQLPQWVQNNNPLLKKGFAKIIKQYIKTNKKMLVYYQTRAPEQEEELEESEEKPKRKKSKSLSQKVVSPKIKSNHKSKNNLQVSVKIPQKVSQNSKSSWMAKFSEPKKLEQIHNMPLQKESVQQAPKKSSKSKKKRAQILSSQYQSQNDSFELQPKKKAKKEIKKEKIIEKQQTVIKKQQKVKKFIEAKPLKQQNGQAQYKEQYVKSYNNGPKKFFSRINMNQVGEIKQELKDNSFHAKARYGQQGDSWGQFGYDKLKDTRGQSFKKTKGKLKNRDFQGALMDINKINSIPIL